MSELLLWTIIITVFILLTGLRIVNEYERGVVLTLGKYTSTRQPGLTWIFWPFKVQRMIKTDMRVRTVNIPRQEVITKDNVTVGVDGIVYYKIINASDSVIEIQDYEHSTALFAQAALRDIIGEVELDTLLSERKRVAKEIKITVDEATEPWGIDITYVKMQDIELPADMKRVMANQAEAERERRAVIIQAEGEYTASEKLARAAKKLSDAPGGIQLRTLKTIEKIDPDPSNTIIFGPSLETADNIKNSLLGDNSNSNS